MGFFRKKGMLVEKGYQKGAIVEALKNYPDRNFDLIKAIEKEKEYHWKPYRRDKRVREDFTRKYKVETNYKMWINPGQMLMFDYLKPIHKDELEYYDAMPMTIFFGTVKTSNGPRVIGWNIHYYPPEIRYQLLDWMLKLHRSDYMKYWEEPQPREIQGFQPLMLVHKLREAKLDFGIRMYDPTLMRNIRPLPTKAWSRAVFTEGRFMKRTRSAIMNYWSTAKDQDAKTRRKLKKAENATKRHIKKTKNKYG